MNRLVLPSLLLLAACSSDPGVPATQTDSGAPPPDGSVNSADTSTAGDANTVVTSETWQDGKMITTSVVIPAGITVTIAKGAKIACSANVSITVLGTLTASSASPTHAKLMGTKWIGIIAKGKGTVSLDGVDITGATVAAIEDGSTTPAIYDNGTIDKSGSAFGVALGAALSTHHAIVTAPNNYIRVEGSFTASYLDYDANGIYCVYTDNLAAKVSIEDSKFHGGASGDPDLLNSYGAALFHVAYTDITGAHCGFHFQSVDVLEVDHVTVHGVTNGADLWGSSKSGAHTITNSNFQNLALGFDEKGSNGPIEVVGCYLGGGNNLTTSAVTISKPASMPIANAGPR